MKLVVSGVNSSVNVFLDLARAKTVHDYVRDVCDGKTTFHPLSMIIYIRSDEYSVVRDGRVNGEEKQRAIDDIKELPKSDRILTSSSGYIIVDIDNRAVMIVLHLSSF